MKTLKETQQSDGDALYHCKKNGWGIEPHPVLPSKAQVQHYPSQELMDYQLVIR